MNESRRNIVVAIFVLGGLVILGIMILLFGARPQIFADRNRYVITILFPSAGPIQGDHPVYVNGIGVGRVWYVEPLPDIREGVKVVCYINKGIRIPVSATPLIKEQSIGFGTPAIRIEVGPHDSGKMLPEDGTGVLHGQIAAGIAEVIPKEIISKIEDTAVAVTDLARALKPVAGDLHQLLKPLSTQAVDTATGPARPMANVSTAVQRLDEALKSFNDVLANPRNKRNITVMIENFRVVSENGIKLTQRLNELTASADAKINKLGAGLIDSTDKLSQLFDKLNEVAAKMNSGEGTAGKLFNDPELYDALTDTAKRLQLAVDDLRILIQQWQEKGLKIQGGLLGK